MPFSLRLVLFLALALCGPASVQGQTVISLPVGIGLANPRAIAVDGSGNIFVADTGNNTIQEIPAAGGYMSVTRLAAAYGNFNAPQGLAVDGSGNLFVVDTGNNAVKEILASGGYVTVTTLAPASDEFNAPAAIAVDAAGNVFVADTGNNAVKEILASGGYVTIETLAAATGGSGRPVSIAVDSQDNVFIGFIGGSSATGLEEILAAGGYVTAKPIGGGTVGAQAIAIDKHDNLYAMFTFTVADEVEASPIDELTAASGYTAVTSIFPQASFPTIKSAIALDSSGNIFATTLASTLVQEYPVAQSYAAVAIPAATSLFSSPLGVAVDGSGNVFVADNGNNVIKEIPAAGGFATVTTLAGTAGKLNEPGALAIDHGGNLFVVDLDDIKEIVAAGGYTTVTTLPAGGSLIDVVGIATDADGNVFVTESVRNLVVEIPASGGYTTVETLAAANGNFNGPTGVAVDGSGNVFVADDGHGVLKEILASGGYVTVNTLAAGGNSQAVMRGIAVDAVGNVFVLSFSGIPSLTAPGTLVESLAASGYAVARTLAAATGNFVTPYQLAVDAAGNVYVADTGNNAVKKIVLSPSPLAAAILPGSRSVEIGTPATVFASMLNAGTSDLTDCLPSLPATAPSGITLDYRPTNPSTNQVIGVLDQPVPIPANGSQSFVLGFTAASAVSAPALPVVFGCAAIDAAPVTAGVNTVDLLFSATPIADIIALAATSSNDGTVHVGTGGGAFAIATIDAGAAASLTVEADTGSATLPVTVTLCQTNAGAQCLAPPAASIPISFAANATPTFSIFVAAQATVPFDPGNSRIFVRFKDGSGTSHGSTSVAVTTS